MEKLRMEVFDSSESPQDIVRYANDPEDNDTDLFITNDIDQFISMPQQLIPLAQKYIKELNKEIKNRKNLDVNSN
jgi:hypothetical protein